MRVDRIEIAWFRGAALEACLAPSSKSLVVYGANGSGKSSFVDAVEFMIKGGKLGHLSHEYSGRRQEKGIINTHTPPEARTELGIGFQDGSEVSVEIGRDGSWRANGNTALMASWEYQRTVLRQDEVASFITSRKGEKYSALLPLLGLDSLETCAENLRLLAKAVEQQSGLTRLKNQLVDAENRRASVPGLATDAEVDAMMKGLREKYCSGAPDTYDLSQCCAEVESAIATRIEGFSTDHQRHLALRELGESDIKSCISEVRGTAAALADETEPLISEKLEVLRSAEAFSSRLEDLNQIRCPACGQLVDADAMRMHVSVEHERLRKALEVFTAHKRAVAGLAVSVQLLQSMLAKPVLESWCADLAGGEFDLALTSIKSVDVERLRSSCSEEAVNCIYENAVPLIEAAAEASEDPVTDVQAIHEDGKIVQACAAVATGRVAAKAIERVEILTRCLKSMERSSREKIRHRSQEIVGDISADIQNMWKILHPMDDIEHVQLQLNDDTDKAIDIALKFHGVEQESPRLTLSEGHRNSLGLCIFLAMAARGDDDRPLILDDVVISLDREHRGMVVELLEQHFSGRQVILLTHDRDWYAELRQILDSSTWAFKVLLPYDSPETGIRMSTVASTFDDARAQLATAPDAAGNTARKIMDVELAIRAERLKIALPFLRFERNDRRMAHDFLGRIAADAERSLRRMDSGCSRPIPEAVEALREADCLLVAWGNRSSHSFDVVRPEAAKLIDVCEAALAVFICPECSKPVYKLEDARAGFLQCQCGTLRWRYG